MICNPNPLPSPTGFVVKNASNILVRISGRIPGPLSSIEIPMYDPLYSGSRLSISGKFLISALGNISRLSFPTP